MIISGILGIIGFLIGIAIYANNRGESDWYFLCPLAIAFVGGMVGLLIDNMMQSAKNTKDKRPLMKNLLLFTIVAMSFTMTAFLVSWDINFEHGFGSVIRQLLLNPILFLMRYFDDNKNVIILIAYIVIVIYAILISLMYGYSSVASTPAEHEGKYKVAVDETTGMEVGERKYLDSSVEAFKANAKIVALIFFVTLIIPFFTYSFGISIVFERKLAAKKGVWGVFGFAIGLTIALYILMYILIRIIV